MYNKGMHLEILVGFFLILTISDSRLRELSFAANVKNIYILFISLISFKETRLIDKPVTIHKNFILFFILSFICVLFSPNINLSFQKTLSYVLLFCFVPNYFLFIYREYGDILFKKIVFFVLCILILGLIYNILFPNITNLVGRYRGLLGNPNGLGLYTFLFIIFFTVINECNPTIFTRQEKLIVYGLSFFSLLKCGARASLMATILFFFFRKFYKMSPWFGFLIFIITLFVYQLISSNLVEIITTLGLGDELRVDTLQNGSGRIIAWKFAWEKIQENFYLGKGFNYTEYIFLINYDYLSMLGHQGSAHNMYLTFWLDTGLVGLILFLFGLLVTFYKASKHSKLAIPILYAVLFSNNYESWLTASLNPFTIQLLFILTVIFIYKNDEMINHEVKIA